MKWEARKAAEFLLKKRGYVVIVTKPGKKYDLGDKTKAFSATPIHHILTIMSPATPEHLRIQMKDLGLPMPKITEKNGLYIAIKENAQAKPPKKKAPKKLKRKRRSMK